MGIVKAVCISEKKGTAKKNIGECNLIAEYGLKNDAHGGSERQVSLLSYEIETAFAKKTGLDIEPGVFGENLLVSGFDFKKCAIGTRFVCNDVVLEITQVGKICHEGCNIRQMTGDCIMPREGVFAKVISGGKISVGDEMSIEKRAYTAAVITASDRSFEGVREDKSGPLVKELLEGYGYKVISYDLLSDDENMIYKRLVEISDNDMPDVIFTTGGTGFSVRDRVPEATLKAGDRNVPGISQAIRNYSFNITPKAMLSRAESVIRKRTIIINLPGSPKAVRECLEFVVPTLSHGIDILRGEADG
ncbi:MAG: molybdenum cofactor biosynthesis protein [Lachnospiraceae bacterium]|nr:molybdenum cofactor biosynthesis protein [Lachnospiraceae bacterium]